MADEISLKINLQTIVQGEDGVRKLTNAFNVLNQTAKGIDLNRFWKGTDDGAKRAIMLANELNAAIKQVGKTDGRITMGKELADEITKISNALKASVAKNDLSKYITSTMTPYITEAEKLSGEIGALYNQNYFQNIFEGFSVGTKSIENFEGLLSQLANNAAPDALKAKISSLTEELTKARAEIDSLNDTINLSKSANGIKEVQGQVDNLTTKLENLKTKFLLEFTNFLRGNGINSSDVTAAPYLKNIEQGLMTGREAIIAYRQEYESLLLDYNKSGGNLGADQIEKLTSSLERAITIFDELQGKAGKGIGVGSTGGTVASAQEAAQAIQNITASTNGKGGNIEATASQIKDLASAFSGFQGIDFKSVSDTFASLALMGSKKSNGGSLAKLAEFLTAIGNISNTTNLLALSGLKLSNLELPKGTVNGTALKNLATYLPRFAEIDVSAIERLTKLNFENLNNINLKSDKFKNLASLTVITEVADALKNTMAQMGKVKAAEPNIKVDSIKQSVSALKEYDQQVKTSAAASEAILAQKAAFDALLPSINAVKSGYTSLTKNTGYLKSGSNNFESIKAQYEELMYLVNQYRDASKDKTTRGLANSQDIFGNIQNKVSQIQAAINKEKEFISQLKNEASSVKQTTDSYKSREALLRKSEALQKRLEKTTGWTASQKGRTSGEYESLQRYKSQLEELSAKFSSGQIKANEFQAALSGIQKGANSSISAIQQAGEATQTFGQRMAGVIKFATQWFGTYRIIMMVWSKIKELAQASVELDTAFTQLQIVTKASDSSLESYGRSLASTAQQISASMTDLIDSTTTFARLGYNLDESSELAKYTAMLKNVGDIEVGDAQDSITSIIKAFDIDVSEIESVMDKLVVTGNNFPISVSQIAEGMNNASSALNAAGNSFEESVALLTAANTTVQNASKSSTGLRTIAARIRNTKTELDELGEEPITESKYAELVNQLSKYKVSLTDVNGEYRSTYDIIQDLAGAWDKMGSMEQAAIATALAGTRQQDVFFSLVGQFQEASNAMEMMSNSAGELEESYNIHLDSVQAHIDRLKAAFQGLGQDMFKTDTLKVFTDIGTGALNALDGVTRLVDKIGMIPTVMAAVSAISMMRGGNMLQFFRTVEDNKAFANMRMMSAFGGRQFQPLSIADNSNSAFSQTLKSDIQNLTVLAQAEDGAAIAADRLAAVRARLSTSSLPFYEQNQGYLNQKNANGEYVLIKDYEKSAKQTELATIAQNKSFANVRQILNQYNKDLNVTGLNQQEFASSVGQSNKVLGAYVATTKSGQASFSGYIGKLAATKAATLGLQAATMALNMALSMAIGALISFAIQGLGKVIDYIGKVNRSYSDKIKDIRKSMSEITSDIQQVNSDYQNLNNTFQDVVPRFAELSKGVDSLGNNMSLTEEEYQEYWELNNKIAEMFPEISGGMDSNGNAMLTLSGNADTLTESLEKLLETQRQLANEKVAEKMPDLVGQAEKADVLSAAQKKAYQERLDMLNEIKGKYDKLKSEGLSEDEINYELNNLYNALESSAKLSDGVINTFEKKFEESVQSGNLMFGQNMIGTDFTSVINNIIKPLLSKDAQKELTNSTHSLIETLISSLTDESAIAADKADEESSKIINEFFDGYRTSIDRWEKRGSLGMWHHDMIDGMVNFTEMLKDNGLDNEVAFFEKQLEDIEQIRDAIWQGMAPAFSSWAQIQDGIPELSKEMQDAITKMVSNIDYGTIDLSKNINLASEEGIEQYITDHILAPIKDLSVEAQADLANYFNITPSDKSISEYISSLREQLQLVADESKFSFNDLFTLLGADKIEDEYRKNADLLISRLKDLSIDEHEITQTNALGRLFALPVDEFQEAFDAVTKYGIDSFQGMMDAVERNTFELPFNIEEEAKSSEALYEAISKAQSATGLLTKSTKDSEASVEALNTRYSALGDSFDPEKLFERTIYGVRLNTEEVGRLESEYNKLRQTDLDSKLEDLTSQYNKLTKEMDGNISASERLEKSQQRDDIAAKINEVADLAAQYSGLTSAYNNWINAQGTTDQNDMYSKVSEGVEKTKKLFEEGWVGTDDFQKAVQLMTDEDLSNASLDHLIEVYKAGLPAQERFFKGIEDGKEGLKDFANVAVEASTAAGEDWFTYDDEGYHVNIDIGETGELVKAIEEMTGLKMSSEEVDIILQALTAQGWDIEIESEYSQEQLGLLKTKAEEAVDNLEELGLLPSEYKFDFNAKGTELDDEISNATELFNELARGKDGKINLKAEGVEDVETVLETLLEQKELLEEPAVMSINTDEISDEKLANGLRLVQNFQQKVQELNVANKMNEIGFEVDTSGIQQEISNTAQELSELSPEIAAELNIDSEQVQTALDEMAGLSETDIEVGIKVPEEQITTVTNAIDSIDPKKIEMKTNANQVKGEINSVDQMSIGDKVFNIIAYAADAVSTLINIRNWKLPDKTVTIKANDQTGGTTTAQGTAYASGDWRIKGRGTALGGELGREIVVRDGRWFTIGDNGAEFFHYEPNDIVFNAEQTEQLLRKGKITNGQKRGRAYLNGTAFASNGRYEGGGKFYDDDGGNNGGDNGNGNGNDNGNDNSKKVKEETKKDTKEIVDWIEILISRIERKIEHFKNIATSSFRTLGQRLRATHAEMSTITQEIKYQQKGYERYMKEAESVGLSASLKKKVQNGTIDITEYSDETAELIKEYQKWYEKALDCADAVDTLHENLASLYQDDFNNIQTNYDNQLSLLEHLTTSYQTQMDKLTEMGYMGSTKVYQKMNNVEKKNIKTLEKELKRLEDARDAAVDSGAIAIGSEAWYEMQQNINKVKEAIDEASLSTEKNKKAIRELKREYFDFAREQENQLTQESDFLIDLMGNSNLYKKNGQLNNRGQATAALHLQNYDVYMNQADTYGRAIARINKKLAKDPYNTELINRRSELIKLQQDSIKSANGEKEAIKKLVEEGIKIELENMKNLIDKHKEALDSAKDLYEYQKKIADKTKNIAQIEKQLAAYRGDNSEETKATVQKLKVELEEAQTDLRETEYDKFVSDSKKLLDDLYADYEETLNKRLDNIDELMGDLIKDTNSNSKNVRRTLKVVTKEVGVKLSNEMKKVWTPEKGKKVVSEYGSKLSKLTTIADVLKDIKQYVKDMQKYNNDKIKDETLDKNGWKKESGNWVYYQNNKKQTGWVKENDNWYYMNSKGIMQTGWQKYKDKWYYMNSKGIMQTGWQKYKDKWYYLGTGGAMQTGWVQVDGKWYYLDKNGVMVTGKKKIGSKTYNFLPNGVWDGVAGYAKGGLVDSTGLQWLDGTKSNPEVVLSASDSANFIKLRDALRDMAATNQLAKLSGNHSALAGIGANGVSIGDTTLNIMIDHVEDYNDFVNQLKSDRKFEQFVQTITIDRVAGGNTLKKNNINW